MDSYAYPFGPPFPPHRPPDGLYPDHGDGFGEFYGLGPLNEDVGPRSSRSKQRPRRARARSRTSSKSRSQSRERDLSRESRTKSKSRSQSRSHSRSGARHKELTFRDPSFLDAFRVLYLAPSQHKKNTPKYLATQKRRDRIQEYLKSDGLGSKRWLFYPRQSVHKEASEVEQPRTRENCDQRVKVDGDFFRKYRRRKKVDADAPIAKLKRWELVFYKKLGFVQAV